MPQSHVRGTKIVFWFSWLLMESRYFFHRHCFRGRTAAGNRRLPPFFKFSWHYWLFLHFETKHKGLQRKISGLQSQYVENEKKNFFRFNQIVSFETSYDMNNKWIIDMKNERIFFCNWCWTSSEVTFFEANFCNFKIPFLCYFHVTFELSKKSKVKCFVGGWPRLLILGSWVHKMNRNVSLIFKHKNVFQKHL